MVNIESTMEKIARIYSGTDITVRFGPTFATDSTSTIWIPPISDQADPWVRFETEVATYHEMGHIRRYKNPKTKKVYASMRNDKALHKVFNAVEDVPTDGELLSYPGIRMKQVEFIRTFVDKEVHDRFADPRSSVLKKILDYTYLRAKEHQLGINLKLTLPAATKAMWDRIVGEKLAKEIASETDPERIGDISKQIFEKVKDLSEQEPPQNSGGEGEDNDGESDQEGASSGGSESGAKKKSDKNKKSDSKKNSSSRSDSQNGQGDDSDDKGDADAESGDSNEQTGSGDRSRRPSSDSADAPEEGGSSGDKGADEDAQPEGNGRSDLSGKDLNDLQKQARDVLDELNSNDDTSTINDDVKKHVHNYLDTNHVYREVPGLQETFYRQSDPMRDVSYYENQGRALTGYIGAKLRTLLISERAQRWFRVQRSGKLDVRRLWVDHSDAVYKKRLESMYEDSAVFMVMDNSGSMDGYKGEVATCLMTSLASELDRLRVPFAAAGYTSERTARANRNCDLNDAGIRTAPSLIQIIKTFDEPYRRTCGRFRWPSTCDITVDFPCVRFGAQMLAQRRETKKVLFVFSDGETATGNDHLNSAMRKAMKEYVLMLLRHGMFVVGFELESRSLRQLIPDTIYISCNNLSDLPARFYKELLDILLFRKGTHV
jgi:cobalamin biosynthesis protein CobT